MRDFKWSEAEKKVAKRVFDVALRNETQTLIQKFKHFAAKVEQIDDLWAIHDDLAEQRRAIDEKYDYRYSQLIMLFGRLLGERWIDDKDLEELGEEKLKAIRHIAGWAQ